MFLQKSKQNKTEGKRKHELQNPKILEVNLIKEETTIVFDWRKNLLVLAAVLSLAMLLLVEVYFGLNWWEKQEAIQIQSLNEKVVKLDAESNKLKKAASAALSYKEKSMVFTGLLDNHVYWSNFFAWLEKNTLSSVQFGGFSGKLDGKYSFAADADSYADVSWQIKTLLNDPLTKSAKVSSVAAGKSTTKNGGVAFTLNLEVDPKIFKK